MHRLRITYAGRVQGVGFRATAASIAQRLPLTGWVQNEPDGGVLLEVQGRADQIEAFRDALRRRMERNIQAESVATIPPIEGESGFTIRRA